MEKIRIIFDIEGNTLDIWFDDPKKEVISQETDDEIILKKDAQGKVIGFEMLHLPFSLKTVGLKTPGKNSIEVKVR